VDRWESSCVHRVGQRGTSKLSSMCIFLSIMNLGSLMNLEFNLKMFWQDYGLFFLLLLFFFYSGIHTIGQNITIQMNRYCDEKTKTK